MTTAASVIRAIESRRPGLKPGKQQLLLFFCQGHHVGHANQPLFDEAIYATTEATATVYTDTPHAPPITTELELNTIGYVIERYGALSPADLRTLIRASLPWEMATKAATTTRIDLSLLRDWFLRDDETDDPDDERPNRAERDEVNTYWAETKR